MKESLQKVMTSHGPGGACQHGVMETTWTVMMGPAHSRVVAIGRTSLPQSVRALLFQRKTAVDGIAAPLAVVAFV